MEDRTSFTLRNVSDIGTTREEIALDARSARGRTFTSGMEHLTFRTTSSFVCKKTKSVEEEERKKEGTYKPVYPNQEPEKREQWKHKSRKTKRWKRWASEYKGKERNKVRDTRPQHEPSYTCHNEGKL